MGLQHILLRHHTLLRSNLLHYNALFYPHLRQCHRTNLAIRATIRGQDHQKGQITSATYVSEHGCIPPMPLCLRPPIHETCMEDIMTWKHDTEERITAIGDRFESLDGGPSAAELLREVTWSLEDSVAGLNQGDGRGWVACQWRNVEAEVRAAVAKKQQVSGWQLRLRTTVEHLRDCWRRRLELREPFQYIMCTAHWREHVLSVSPGVLIPRPETEIFPDLVAEALDINPDLATRPWADLGTGSGAIGIGAAIELRKRNNAAKIWAVDLSPIAAAHAEYNARLTGVSDHVHVVTGSWCEPLVVSGLTGRLGGLLSNPPYIPRDQMSGLQREVGAHEPESALDGGEGPGMDSLAVICEQAVNMLSPGGFLALETAGKSQAERVQALLCNLRYDGGLAFQDAKIIQDCFGVERFVTAIRQNRNETNQWLRQ